jgi:ATP-dependent RNA helicase RhlE
VLIATDIAARGIDVDAVSHVVNYELPHEPETYVHRIGRTGRAGQSGTAVSFCDHEERPRLAAIERLIRMRIPAENAPEGISASIEPQSDRGHDRRPRGGRSGGSGRQQRRGGSGRREGGSRSSERRALHQQRRPPQQPRRRPRVRDAASTAGRCRSTGVGQASRLPSLATGTVAPHRPGNRDGCPT